MKTIFDELPYIKYRKCNRKMYYRSNNILVYLSPDEDGNLLLHHALFFQQTLGMRVFICSINETLPVFKKFFQSEKNRSKLYS